jgi:molybdate transport system ATP-binding protein
MGNILSLRLRKSYSDFELAVSAAFPSGIVAVFGPSGSGKTTLLNCVAGLVSPDEGEISLNGETLFSAAKKLDLPPERRRIGYMFQDSLLFPHLTVKENIHYGYRLTPPQMRRINPSQLVELLELGPLMDRRPESLSAGERQRVMLARALATSPKLLLLDEPLASLHTAIKGRILRYLKAVDRELAIPMIYVSHSISEVLALAHKVLILNRGSQVTYDEPRKLLSQPAVIPTVDVESLENLFDVEVLEHRPASGISLTRLGETILALPRLGQEAGKVISVAIRASDIILASVKPEKISARNILKARIEEIHSLGPRVLVQAYLDQPWLVEITPDALTNLDLREGQDVYLVLKSSSIMILD